MDWRQIPSLSGLRAFEATARLGSFSAAARSLNVTHAAIAQHVRALEAFFATDLVFRSGRKMDLTQAGKQLATSLQEGFGLIEAGVRDIHARASSRPLQVTMTPSFAENWLMPRLGAFWADHPEVELALKPTANCAELRRDGLDLAIRYGDGNWPEYTVERLTSAQVVIVGSPKLVGDGKGYSIREMQELPWQRESLVPEHNIWAKQQGLDLSKAKSTFFDTNTLVLSAVRAGYGLSIQARALVEQDLINGTLVCLMESRKMHVGYFLLTLPNRQSPQLTTLIKWLRCCA